MLAVAEETGEMPALLGEIADMYEREVDYEINTLAANIEPIITVALGVLGFMAYKASAAGRFAWDRTKLRLPIAGRIVFKATLARFARALSIATKAGVPIVQGLSVVAGVVDNAYLAKSVEEMRQGVERGESVARTAAGSGIFNQVVLQMLAVGEETGEMPALLGEIADMYEREVDYEIKTLAANIEPIITVALGVLVLLLALGVFLPIWEMSSVMLKR
jgi:MSHA biogenesis protein MshG